MEYAKQFQLRRGTLAEHQTFTGAEGEPTYISDLMRIAIHDGKRVGGYVLLCQEDLQGYVREETLNNYRNKENKINISDLTEDLQTQIINKYNDTEIRALIAGLESSKLGVTEATNKFRLKDTSITMQDLDESLQTILSDFNNVKGLINDKADRTELSDYRKNSVTITLNDLNDSLQEKINTIAVNQNTISELSNSIGALGGRIQDLEENGVSGGGSGTVGESLWTQDEKNTALADIDALKKASSEHALASDLTELQNTVISVEALCNSHATTSQLQTVSTMAEKNTNDIGTLTTKVSSLEVAIEGLKPSEGEGDTDITSAEFNALASKVTANEGAISTLSTTFGSINNAISGSGGLEDRTTGLENEMATVKTNTSSALSNSEANTQAINEINTKLGNYSTEDHDKIISNSNEISTIKNSVTDNTNNISSLEAKIGSSGSTDTTTVFGKVNDVAKDITTLNGGVNDAGSIKYQIANTNHGDLKNLNTDEVRHISQSEYEQMLNILAMNASLTQALVDIEALKNATPSAPAGEVYTDITGATRTLKYKMLFTTTGTSVVLYNQNKFKDGGYANLTEADIFGDYMTTEDDADLYKNNKVEVYSYGVSGNPYTEALYLPYSDQVGAVSVPVESQYFSSCDIEAETGKITFNDPTTGGTFLIEVRVYE